jgi:NADH-quinone oxidoreductase subunit M
MINAVIFLPLATGLAVLLAPRSRPAVIRAGALVGALATLALSIVLWVGYDPAGPALQWRAQAAWIPSIGAGYDVAVDGLSLPLILLTTLLSALVMVYVLRAYDRPKAHAFLFLLMETGLLGLFAARDLLLFYVFFEIGLVPLYFIIGIWGHERRRYAALKFFLYTRAGSLAMLLAFLGLYLSMTPHTFSLPAIAADLPLAGSPAAAGLVLAGLMIGFGVKLPIVPLHNWLPDAHVEAPTEGSVILAGLLLKMGGYGMIQVMLRTVPGAVQKAALPLLVVALVSVAYGALAALAQSDLKRLVAYTSVNHMGYVLLGVAVWGLTTDTSVRQLALNGATLQMVSHGLLTGGLFFMVGILQQRAGTREMDRFGGLLGRLPVYSGLLGLLAFGSLGLPGLSGFAAEFQIFGATLQVSVAAAALALLGVLITTGLFVRVLIQVVMGEVPRDLAGEMTALRDVGALELVAVVPLAVFSLLIGIVPGTVLPVIESATRLLAGGF